MQLPLNVSSVSTSFIGLSRLGIHLVLYVACCYASLTNFACFLVYACILCFTLQIVANWPLIGKIEENY